MPCFTVDSGLGKNAGCDPKMHEPQNKCNLLLPCV